MYSHPEGVQFKYDPPWFVKLIVYSIIFGGGSWVLVEVVFNFHDETDICERAAVEPKAFRDVLRMCQLGEYRQLPPDPNEED